MSLELNIYISIMELRNNQPTSDVYRAIATQLWRISESEIQKFKASKM